MTGETSWQVWVDKDGETCIARAATLLTAYMKVQPLAWKVEEGGGGG